MSDVVSLRITRDDFRRAFRGSCSTRANKLCNTCVIAVAAIRKGMGNHVYSSGVICLAQIDAYGEPYNPVTKYRPACNRQRQIIGLFDHATIAHVQNGIKAYPDKLYKEAKQKGLLSLDFVKA